MRRLVSAVRATAARAAGACLLSLALAAPAARAQGALSALETDLDQIASRARGSVVSVFAQRTLEQKDARLRQVVRRPHTRMGSGVAIRADVVLTTASVVLGAERLLVRSAGGQQSEGVLVAMDPVTNVALVRVPGLSLPPLPTAERRPAQLGDWVVTLGTSYRAQATQSVGTVQWRHREPRLSLLQLTNAVFPGNSGGAALNARGELVGIVQGELGSPDLGDRRNGERRPAGMSFALPIDEIRPVIDDMLSLGRVRHGWMGISTRAASVLGEGGDRVPIGALVESVVPDGPGARAGLRKGDLIVAFERERVEYPTQLGRWVSAARPGTVVSLVWVRDEVEHNGRATLGESPDPAPEWAVAGLQAPAAASAPPRITEIERQIKELNRELDRLKTTPR